MKYRQTDLEWFTCGFAFDTTKRFVALIQKEKAWCKGFLNGIGGSIEPTDHSPMHAQRREFEEETGLSIENWEFFCQLQEPNGVVEFFRATVPIGYLKQVQSTTIEKVDVYDWVFLKSVLNTMPNLSWLVPLALSPNRVIARVQEFEFAGAVQYKP